MKNKTPIELLAPAKNLQSGKVAINYGADAVYIGVSRYGARAAAGNPVGEIGQLIQYAHFYNARVYVNHYQPVERSILSKMRGRGG